VNPFTAVGSILIAAGLLGIVGGGAVELIFRSSANPEAIGALACLLLLGMGLGAWGLGGD
jgi:hypothetical protein